jgi:hypothetical protein
MKVRICRRERKESGYWLGLLDADSNLEPEWQRLAAEAKVFEFRVFRFSSFVF